MGKIAIRIPIAKFEGSERLAGERTNDIIAMLAGVKAEAIRRGVNLYLKDRYGEVQSLEVDSRRRSLRVHVLLKGEAEIVDIEVGTYEIDESGEALVLYFREIRVSRPWMEELAKVYGEGKPIQIPQGLAGLVKMVLG